MNKNKIIDTKYIVAIIISLIIGASIFGYGYLNYKYKKEALDQETQSELSKQVLDIVEEDSQQKQLQNCLDDVSSRASKAFENNKNLNNDDLKIILDFIQKQKDDCFKKFPQ